MQREILFKNNANVVFLISFVGVVALVVFVSSYRGELENEIPKIETREFPESANKKIVDADWEYPPASVEALIPTPRTVGMRLSPQLSHSGSISDIDFSNDGATLLSGADDGRVCFWEIKSGNLLWSYVVGEPVLSVDLANDGWRALVSTSSGAIILDAVTAEPLATLPLKGLVGAKFSPSCDSLLFYSEDGKAYLKNLNGELIWEIDAHKGPINDGCFNSIGTELATGGKDGLVKLWNVIDGEPMSEFSLDPIYDVTFGGSVLPPIKNVSFSPGNKYVLVGGDTVLGSGSISLPQGVASEKLLKLFNKKSKQEVKSWYSKTVIHSEFQPNLPQILLISDRVAGLVSIAPMNSKQQLESMFRVGPFAERVKDSANLGAASISRDGRTIALGVGSNIELWDVSKAPKLNWRSKTYASLLTSIDYSSKKNLLALGGQSFVSLLNLGSPRVVTFPVKDSVRVNLAGNGKTLAVGRRSGSVFFHDLILGNGYEKKLQTKVDQVAFNNDNSMAAFLDQQKICLIDLGKNLFSPTRRASERSLSGLQLSDSDYVNVLDAAFVKDKLIVGMGEHLMPIATKVNFEVFLADVSYKSACDIPLDPMMASNISIDRQSGDFLIVGGLGGYRFEPLSELSKLAPESNSFYTWHYFARNFQMFNSQCILCVGAKLRMQDIETDEVVWERDDLKPNGYSNLSSEFVTVCENGDKSSCELHLLSARDGKTLCQFSDSNSIGLVSVSSQAKRIAYVTPDYLKVIASDGTLQLKLPNSNEISAIALNENGSRLLVGKFSGRLELWDVEERSRLFEFESSSQLLHVSFSQNDRRFAVSNDEHDIYVFESSSDGPMKIATIETKYHLVVDFKFDSSGNIVTLSRQMPFFSDGTLKVCDLDSPKVKELVFPNCYPEALAVSENEEFVVLGNTFGDGKVRVIETEGWKVVDILDYSRGVNQVAISPDCETILTGSLGGAILRWTRENGEWSNNSKVMQLEGHTAGIRGLAIRNDGVGVSCSLDGTTRLWNSDGNETCQLIFLKNGDWVALEPKTGRFESNNIEALKAIGFSLTDQPFVLASPEIFFRDFYETDLVQKVLSSSVYSNNRSLVDLNRVQPEVSSLRISQSNRNSGMVKVEVDVSGASDFFRNGDREREMSTGVYDLRLFRDGQLVGQYPPESADAALPTIARTESDREQWRKASLVCEADGSKTVTFPVQLPRNRPAGEQVEFTAYAFNRDRVKSVTARELHPIPVGLEKVTPTAFIVGVGVDAYEGDVVGDLDYAAADARLLLSDLVPRFVKLGYHVNEAALVSAIPQSDSTLKRPTESPASKENIRKTIERIQQAACPDDIVILCFSSHGYTSEDGMFYIFPHDLGEDSLTSVSELATDDRKEFLKTRCVSSDELSVWLRDVDAGEIVMIVDTCHSAAAVEGADFKPGPMGSKGLGQLAYDKGMRILTASQAGDVALESNKIKQGLLTYALVSEGLKSRNADTNKDKQIDLNEWLSYAERRVPSLFDEILNKTFKGNSSEQNVTPMLATNAREYEAKRRQGATIQLGSTTSVVQTPKLFQFHRKEEPVFLIK